jgi:HD-GYP domain-containing protein (c-di-GMP phosphodiesterase class II)
MELGESDVCDVYYTTLLRHVGCTAPSHETAALLGGDDIAIRAGGEGVDFTNPKEALSYFLFEVGKGATPLGRARAVFMAVSKGQRFDRELNLFSCEVAAHMARRLSLGSVVQRSLNEIEERWDGKRTRGLSGEDIALPVRFAQAASQAMLFARLGGPDLAVEVIGRRAGTALDPSIADAFLRCGRELLAEVASSDACVAVIEAEPEPCRRIAEPDLDNVARAFADMVDLKSPYTHGHSSGVARLAEAAAEDLGLGRDEVANVRRAGLLHDLGKVGVPNGIWDKPGPLTETE